MKTSTMLMIFMFEWIVIGGMNIFAFNNNDFAIHRIVFLLDIVASAALIILIILMLILAFKRGW